MSMTTGERIAALRKGRGMTQEQLAEGLGVTRQSVSKWELDQATPEVGCAVALCDLFGVSLDYLLRGVEPFPAAEVPSLMQTGEKRREEPLPARPKPLTGKGYLLLFGSLFAFAGVLGLHLFPIAHNIDPEAVILIAMLLFAVLIPLPAVYLATCRWHYPDRRNGFRHLWMLTAAEVVVGNLLLLSGVMLYLRYAADEYFFWARSWEEMWYDCLLAELFVLAILLPLLVCFHEKKWLCWVFYILSPNVFIGSMLAQPALTELLPSMGKYWALGDVAVRFAVLVPIVLSRVIVYARLDKGSAPRASEGYRPLTVGMLLGISAVCTFAIPSVWGGLYYALSLAGLSTEFLPLLSASLPALLIVLSRGKTYPTLRLALADAGKVTALFLPLLLAAHMGISYLTQYLLTFGGPMPDLHWGRYLLRSALMAFGGGGIALPALAALRKRRWACVLAWVGFAVVAVAVTVFLPSILY